MPEVKTQVSNQIDFNFEQNNIASPSTGMEWIQVSKNAPYFETESGRPWTPVGQNDAITWPELEGMFRRKDIATVEGYFQMLVAHGVTCLRLMLEYCHGESRYIEKPVGRFQPNMIRLWDDLFAMCEKYRLRILLTPYDTFWMWLRWSHHPYKKSNSGPCSKRSEWLLCPATRIAIKNRLAFATERWGASGALFAWDIWNEIHPAHAGNSTDIFSDFTADIADFLRETEIRIHGRAHPQTVSLFGPVLNTNPAVADCIFRHPSLDFASIHFYEAGTIDHPKNTVDAAISTGRLTREAIGHTTPGRPFFDSEHGPIHTYKDHHKTLPAYFDDEYFRHMQWAHFASGGAGGGMRWPNRRPHTLTPGMRRAQQSLTGFLPLVNWSSFQRKNQNIEVTVSDKSLSVFACSDPCQAVVWLLRTDTLTNQGILNVAAPPLTACIHIPGLQFGNYKITYYNTKEASISDTLVSEYTSGEHFCIPVSGITTDVAIAVANSQ